MPYGTIKIDTITFTDGGVDKSVPVSGLVQNPTFTGNVTVTGTISGNIIQGGTTVSGLTVTGTTANFASGVFTTQISGVTITGTTVSTTTGNFTSLTGTTATITSGIIASGTAALPSLAILSDPNTGIYSPGADQLAVATNGAGALFVDGFGRVGVGAISSGARFEVRGGSGPYMYIVDSGANGGAFVAEATNSIVNIGSTYLGTAAVPLALVVGGVEKARIRADGTFEIKGAGTSGVSPGFSVNPSTPANSFVIDSSGRLGIGTSSPGELLDVAGNIRQTGNTAGTANTVGLIDFYNANNTTIIARVNVRTDGAANNGSYRISTANAGTLNEVVRITSAGLVGIGSTAPSQLLEIKGANARFAVNSTTVADGGILLQGNGTTYAEIKLDASSGVLDIAEKQAAGNITFSTGTTPTERVRVDSSGRLLVGTSSASGAAILQVQTPTTLSTTADAGVSLVNTSTKTYPTSTDFSAIAGLHENIEIGNSAAVTTGFNFVSGNSFLFTKSAGNTQDINGLRHIVLQNVLNWNDLNTCNTYTGIANSFSYSGINANSRTSSLFTGQLNQIALNCPDGQTQTISFVVPYSDYLSITPAGSSTVNITNSFGQSLSMFNNTAGTKTINITTHTFLTTFYTGWGTSSFGTPGTMTVNITTMYGLRLRSPSGPGTGNTLNITNNWGIYQEWSSAKNWFAGASNQFPNITTTASGANAFLDSADSNRLYRSTSSIVYKKDVEDLDHALADNIHQFRPIWYRSNCDADCQDWSWFGLIAEEVAAIEPRLVHYGYQEDAYEMVDITDTVELQPNDPRREAGQETEEITKQERRLKDDAQQVPNGVAYDRLTVLLLDVVQRQENRIKDLEARLSALEAA